MRLGLSADELLSTTRAVRKRLDFDRPIDRAIVLECIDLALQAPNGSNRQGWEWVLVDDEPRRRAVAEVYRANFDALASSSPISDEHAARNATSGAHLAAHLHRCPVLLVPCVRGRHDGLSGAMAAGVWGSLFPAVWSFQLALRERGLGSTFTTLHLHGGGEAAVADILSIPRDEVTQGGLVPVAYTIGTDFRRAQRRSAADVVHWNTW